MTTGGGMGGSGSADVIWIDLQTRMDGIDAQLAELEAKAQGSGERAGAGFGGGLSAGLAVATTAAVALASAVTGIAASSFNLAQESAQNVNEFQAKLGATREEAEALGAVAEQVFANNWTGSLTEAGEAVANVRREIQGLTNEELANVTGMSVAIAETFEEDQAKVAQAIQSVMEATGASVQEATDFIAAGFQNGLNSSEDFLDTLKCYLDLMRKIILLGAVVLFSSVAQAQTASQPQQWEYAEYVDFGGDAHWWLTPDTNGVGRKAQATSLAELLTKAECPTGNNFQNLFSCFGQRGWEMSGVIQDRDSTSIIFKRLKL